MDPAGGEPGHLWSTVPETVGWGLSAEGKPRKGPGPSPQSGDSRGRRGHVRSSAPRPCSHFRFTMSPGAPGRPEHTSCLVLPQTQTCSQLCPPGPKDRPQSTLEEKYGASKLKCSLAIKFNPCIHREKLRLRDSQRPVCNGQSWVSRNSVQRLSLPALLSSSCRRTSS